MGLSSANFSLFNIDEMIRGNCKIFKRWSRDEIFTAENKNPTFPSDSKGFARVLVADTRKQALRDKPCYLLLKRAGVAAQRQGFLA